MVAFVSFVSFVLWEEVVSCLSHRSEVIFASPSEMLLLHRNPWLFSYHWVTILGVIVTVRVTYVTYKLLMLHRNPLQMTNKSFIYDQQLVRFCDFTWVKLEQETNKRYMSNISTFMQRKPGSKSAHETQRLSTVLATIQWIQHNQRDRSNDLTIPPFSFPVLETDERATQSTIIVS